MQYAPLDEENQVYLSAPVKTLIQRIIGIFLYYALALDLIVLVTLGTLVTQQANPTAQLWEDITVFSTMQPPTQTTKLFFMQVI